MLFTSSISMSPSHRAQRVPGPTDLQSATIAPHDKNLALMRFYSRILAAARSSNEVECISKIWEQHTVLGRAPAISEIKQALIGTKISRLSRDRLHQIVANVNDRLAPGATRLQLTVDRPFFRFRANVQSLGLAWFAEHKQCPKRSEWTQMLKQHGLTLSYTTLRNILSDLRRRAPKSQRAAFRFSIRRKDTSWSDIEEAFSRAQQQLKWQGVRRGPSLVEVSLFLRRAGHNLSSRALQSRMRLCPKEVGITLDRYTDPVPDTIRFCHKNLSEAFKRSPSVLELTTEFNRISIRKLSADALWARVSRLNAEPNSKAPLKLLRTMKSSLYEADLQRVAMKHTKKLGRAPTFSELLWAIKCEYPRVKIRADSLHRRCLKLGLKLTHENTLKHQRQRTVMSVMSELKGHLGRKPLKAEVLEALRARGIRLSEVLLLRTLNTSKRRHFLRVRHSLHLASPGRVVGLLSKTVRTLQAQKPNVFPSDSEVARLLGWSKAGVLGAISFVQERRASRRTPPMVLASSPLGIALRDVLTSLRSALGDVRQVEPSIDSINSDRPKSDPSKDQRDGMSQGWQLPELLDAQTVGRHSAEEVLTRGAIHWIHLVCMHAPFRPTVEALEDESRISEFALAKRFGFTSGEKSPFHGMVHALKVAQLAGRRSEVEVLSLLAQAGRLNTMQATLQLLTAELHALAKECGFVPARPEKRNLS